MENLHLKNLNNTNPIEYYFKELEIYENKFEKLTTEVIELYFEQNNPKYNNEESINISKNIDEKENRMEQLKTKYNALTSILSNHFLNELEELNKLNKKLDRNNNIVQTYIDDINNNKEKYLNIENLKNIKNSINSIKTILENDELVIDILKYKI